MILFVDNADRFVMYYYDENMKLQVWLGCYYPMFNNSWSCMGFTHYRTLQEARISIPYRTNCQILFDSGDE